MKTMLAMALAFGFSALGCGVPVDENAPVDEPGVQESALTSYSGYCEITGGPGGAHNGYCKAANGGGVVRAVAAECVGTPFLAPNRTKCGLQRCSCDSTPCTVVQ